ncbi:MAG TPA: hypothetical protein VFN35_25540, partial [Ktedonobacteraceae bacterium]|nr:hypothetical protein [Ktedonobacteraceae bacterium]
LDVTSVNQEPRLQERVLRTARIFWIVFLLLSLCLFLINILQPFFGGKALICPLTYVCIGDDGQLYDIQIRQILAYAQIPLVAYDIYVKAFGIVYALIFLGMSTLLFWRKFEQLAGMLASFAFLLIALNSLAGSPDAVSSGVIALIEAIIGLLLQCCQSFCLGFFLVTFPDGRFVPRWSWLIGFTLLIQAFFFILPPPINILSWAKPYIIVELVLAYGSPVAIQVYRYLRVSTPAQRQQTKWVIFALVIALLCLFLAFFGGALLPDLSILQLATDPLSSIAFLLIPLSISIAILRSRLWDIDVIINRTLVYGLLTVTLVLIYTGLVLGAQSLLAGFISKDNDGAVVVGSTLVVAGLFQPLRAGIQNLIDRRFYRRKYNAVRTLAAFSSTLHQEVDLERLSEQVVMVVQDTVQPVYISLWLLNSNKATSQSLLDFTEEAEM